MSLTIHQGDVVYLQAIPNKAVSPASSGWYMLLRDKTSSNQKYYGLDNGFEVAKSCVSCSKDNISLSHTHLVIEVIDGYEALLKFSKWNFDERILKDIRIAKMINPIRESINKTKKYISELQLEIDKKEQEITDIINSDGRMNQYISVIVHGDKLVLKVPDRLKNQVKVGDNVVMVGQIRTAVLEVFNSSEDLNVSEFYSKL